MILTFSNLGMMEAPCLFIQPDVKDCILGWHKDGADYANGQDLLGALFCRRLNRARFCAAHAAQVCAAAPAEQRLRGLLTLWDAEAARP